MKDFGAKPKNLPLVEFGNSSKLQVGQKVTEDTPLQGMVQKHAPGDKLRLKVWRAGTEFEVTVTLDERKE